MSAVFTDEELAFQADVRQFLSEQAEIVGMRQFYAGRGGATRELYRRLGDRGWLSLTWPARFGGMERPISFEYILWDEMAYARAARPDLGPGIVAKMLIDHGTDEQQERLLPGIRSGERSFALGYSEPDAGSDLTGLRTQASRDGDTYRVRGEKVWTSDAHHSDHLWLLCRTGEPASRSRGLTLLATDLTSPGITIHPIETIDGHRLNQVVLDDVVVPVADRVGEEGMAWTMMRDALAVERHLQLLPGRVRRDYEDLVALMTELGRAAEPGVHQQLGALGARADQVTASSLATVAELERGGSGVATAATAKLLGTSLVQDIARAAVEMAPEAALVRDSTFEFLWRQTHMETIAGGTSEIMLGIVSREALGLGARR